MKRFPLIQLGMALLTLGLLSSCDSNTENSPTNSDGGGDAAIPSTSSVAAPTFSQAGATYTTALSVTLSSSTSGATIYYTTDGSTPTKASTEYIETILVGATETIKAIAVRNDTSSAVSSATYTILTNRGTPGPIPWITSIDYGTLTDARDGQVYKTVTIGTQTWMAENLNYQVDSSWWRNNSQDSGKKYGRVYMWAAAMNLPDSCNKAVCASHIQLNHQGICPSSWHIPSDTEWSKLATYAGGSNAGAKLKSSNGWWKAGYSVANGSDNYGFRAIPAGVRFDYIFGCCFETGELAGFWSSSELNFQIAWFYTLRWDDDALNRLNTNKPVGYSLRCLKD